MNAVAIMGYGVVGTGVAELLARRREPIAQGAGKPLTLKYVLDLKEIPGDPCEGLLTHRFEDVLGDPEVALAVECMGGLTPAYDYTRRLLEAGKSVVTSNKELVAAKGAELLALAAERGVNYLFEASVGGGIPVLHPLWSCLGADGIDEIAGILNGTSNYILTQMNREGASLEAALRTAQALGYAEADPSADIDGADACRKICILASIAFGHHVYPDGLSPEGIRGIAPADVAAASAAGYVIKLIGRVKRQSDGLILTVSPALIAKASPLANVDDVYNAVMVRGGDRGDVLFYGRGAGKLPTASAVISDLIEAARAGGTLLKLHWKEALPGAVLPAARESLPMLVRVRGGGAKAAEHVFGRVHLIEGASAGGELAFITPPCTGERFAELTALSNAMKIEVLSAIRVLPY